MSKEKFAFAHDHLTAVVNNIEDEQTPEGRSVLALQAWQFLVIATRRHLTVDARADICRLTEDLLNGNRNSMNTGDVDGSGRPGDSVTRSRNSETAFVLVKSNSGDVMLARKSLKGPLWNINSDIDERILTIYRNMFFKKITSILDCRTKNAPSTYKFYPTDAAKLTNYIFYDVLGPGIKARMKVLIDICNSQKTNNNAEKVVDKVIDKVINLSHRKDFPLPLRQFFAHLAAVRESESKLQPTHFDHVKSALGYYALWTSWEKIRDLAKKMDPWLQRIFKENDIGKEQDRPLERIFEDNDLTMQHDPKLAREIEENSLRKGQGEYVESLKKGLDLLLRKQLQRVDSAKQLLIELLQNSSSSLDNDLQMGHCLAQMVDHFGIGILILLPNRSLYILPRCGPSRLTAAWPILKRLVPSLEEIAQMAFQEIMQPMINKHTIHLAIGDGNVKCVEDVFSPPVASSNIGNDSPKPRPSIEAKDLQLFLVGDVTGIIDSSE